MVQRMVLFRRHWEKRVLMIHQKSFIERMVEGFPSL